MAASEKRGLGAMSAEARTAAGQKGSSKWEKRYTEFVSYDGMPEVGTGLCFWQDNQLRN